MFNKKIENNSIGDFYYKNKSWWIYPESTWWSISGHETRLQQKLPKCCSVAAFKDLGCLNDPGRRDIGGGFRHSNVLRLCCTNALVPGDGTTFGNPGVLLSVDALRRLGIAVDVSLSCLVKENLKYIDY